MINFRKCEICGKPLEGPEAEQHEVENRRIDPAEDAVLQRDVPGGLPSELVCEECLQRYREQTGQSRSDEVPAR